VHERGTIGVVSAVRVTPLRRALVAIGAAGLVMGVLMTIAIATSDHQVEPGLDAALSLLVAWSFLATGLLVWDRRPDNLVGPLMVAFAFAWMPGRLSAADSPGLYAVGVVLQPLAYGVLVHLLFAFPSGRLEHRSDRVLVALGYFVTVVLPWPAALFLDPASHDCAGCPSNPLLVADDQTALAVLVVLMDGVGLIALAAVIRRFVGRWREAGDSAERLRNAPVWWAGGAAVVFVIALLVTNFLPEEGNYDDYVEYAGLLVLATVPYAFWLGVLRWRLSEADVVAEENVRLDAELQSRLEELRESRARIVEAGYAERRRLERDLHDGAQQRLVALALALRRARAQLDRDPAAAGQLLDEATGELAEATEELRELARGIHPPVLTDRGLVPALEALAGRAPLPVSVEAAGVQPAPPAVEAAAYFVVSEALTNVARHADAETAVVRVASVNGSLEVAVSDDGKGGADTGAGSGLRGLSDRVAALDGVLEVESSKGGGTTIRAVMPASMPSSGELVR
jgi:signal transduction histidine kinase